MQYTLYFQYIHNIFDIFNWLNILKMSPTSQEPGDIYSILSEQWWIYNCFDFNSVIFTVESLPWIHSQIHRNKIDSKFVLDRVHRCLYFRSTKRANKCQESGTSTQNIILRIQKQTNKNKDKTKQKALVKMWEARISWWKFMSGSVILDYLKKNFKDKNDKIFWGQAPLSRILYCIKKQRQKTKQIK